MSGGLLKALRSDSYVELSQYRDQHFRVREAGPREGKVLGRNAEMGICSCLVVSSAILWFLETRNPRYLVVYSLLWVLLVVARGTLPQRGLMSSAISAPRIPTNETL
uniref:Uncharacterized protein n=1 Tax=Equus caballus TaxID=9796 RepID=A0A9L0T8B6_HORSE